MSPSTQPIGKVRRRVQQLNDKIERQQDEIKDLRKSIARLQDMVTAMRQKVQVMERTSV